MSEQPCAEDFNGARALLVDALKQSLVGPSSGENEILDERAAERYHMGFLYSQLDMESTNVNAEEEAEDNRLVESEESESLDDDVMVLSNMKRQSALGLTFPVAAASHIIIDASWAMYRSESLIDGERVSLSWRRVPFHSVNTVNADITPLRGTKVYQEHGVEIRAIVREAGEGLTMTVSFINLTPARLRGKRHIEDSNIYQVMLSVEDESGDASFIPRLASAPMDDEDFWKDELLYREVKPFAVGHGCAVNWDAVGDRARRIWTEWIPQVEVYGASADVLSTEPILDIESLGIREKRVQTLAGLQRLTDAYQSWIDEQDAEEERIVNSFPEALQSKVRTAIRDIILENSASCKRMVSGIEFLAHNEEGWVAFCLGNRAMAQAMRQSRPLEPPRWRAFQLAFLLLALPSTLDAHHEDRQIFDLIWFPTGGGKTEAYLALAAMVIFFRRLSSNERQQSYGLSVLTRYTLRLLTVQQFDRASRMICAAELIRREDPSNLGRHPITIGLFVGAQLTPNTLNQAKKYLDHPDPEGTMTTLPLLECPWCGNPLDPEGQSVDRYLKTGCLNPSCAFHEELPLRIVDEDLYHDPPDMIVATIDKLARMPWEPAMQSLFEPGPSLIIQDELHLIGDSLGTLAALYETVIDTLCKHEGIVAKIVGSTATTRRTQQQVDTLFTRTLRQFPVGGLSARDGFFFREDRSLPGRLYVGVHAQGRSMPHTLERVSSILLQNTQRILDDAVRDQYWTIALYFKALRELGGALVLLQDSVPRYIDSMPGIRAEAVRHITEIVELTSHVPSRKIPEILHRLNQPLEELQTDSQLPDGPPIDVILATNMISVGIDVDRLGIMVLDGQPQGTAEYIQATSRVGRRREAAGLVVTLYNWVRPRDRSHYEQFVPYHQALYRFVESTSATPFSARSRDRALHAVIFALARLSIPELSQNDDAGVIRNPDIQQRVKMLVESVILDRVRQVDPTEVDNTRRHIQRILADWFTMGQEYHDVVWHNALFKAKKPGLLYSTEEGEDQGVLGWRTLQSMRDVSPPSPVRLRTVQELKSMQRGHNAE
ncbi:MAG: helicase [Firmicutes bacterium]|nr:helicase [Bacillota bacterium]